VCSKQKNMWQSVATVLVGNHTNNWGRVRCPAFCGMTAGVPGTVRRHYSLPHTYQRLGPTGHDVEPLHAIAKPAASAVCRCKAIAQQLPLHMEKAHLHMERRMHSVPCSNLSCVATHVIGGNTHSGHGNESKTDCACIQPDCPNSFATAAVQRRHTAGVCTRANQARPAVSQLWRSLKLESHTHTHNSSTEMRQP
jgi:hypothetical protein